MFGCKPKKKLYFIYYFQNALHKKKNIFNKKNYNK